MAKRRTNPVGKQGQSPYQKHKKRPHVYSAALNSWRNAVINRKSTNAKASDDTWHWRMGSGKRADKTGMRIDELVEPDFAEIERHRLHNT